MANLAEVPLEEVACSITEFRQALARLTAAAVQQSHFGLSAVPADQALAYISQLAEILQELAADPNAEEVLGKLRELQVAMGETVRSLQRHGMH